MRTRKDILDELISFKGDIARLLTELGEYPWDSVDSEVTLSRSDLRHVLERFLQTSISASELLDWANAIECRDDIEMADDLQELIFDLANPKTNGYITQEKIVAMLEELR